MRELTVQEVEAVGGGSYLSNISELATQTGFIGGIVGYAVTGTTAGAATGGWWGAGFGAAYGAGYGLGTLIYDRYIQRLILNSGY